MKKQKLSDEDASQLVKELEVERLKKWHISWQDKPWTYSMVSTLKRLPLIIGLALIFKMHQISKVLSDPSVFLRERWWFLLVGLVFFILYHRVVWNNNAFTYFLHSGQDPSLPQPAPDSALVKRGRKVSAALPRKYKYYRNKKYILMLVTGILVPFLFFLVLFLVFLTRGSISGFADFKQQFDPGVLPLLLVIFLVAGLLIGHGIWKGIFDQYHLLQKAKLEV